MKHKFLILIGLILFIPAIIPAQETAPTPPLYSDETMKQLEQLQKAALASDYA